MEGDRVFGNVGHEDRERVALGEPARGQPGSEAAITAVAAISRFPALTAARTTAA
jgi:hypothetical protein